jgi:hypothetical protein
VQKYNPSPPKSGFGFFLFLIDLGKPGLNSCF